MKYGENTYLCDSGYSTCIGENSYSYNGATASWQYYPRYNQEYSPITLKLQSDGGAKSDGDDISFGDVVNIVTNETLEYSEYKYLGAFSTPDCYYYKLDYAGAQQAWKVVDTNGAGSGAVSYGTAFGLVNQHYSNQYLCGSGLWLSSSTTGAYWVAVKEDFQLGHGGEIEKKLKDDHGVQMCYSSDETLYQLPTVADLVSVFAASNLKGKTYRKNSFDCDDFASVLFADSSLYAYANNLPFAYALGLIGGPTQTGGHEINFAYRNDKELVWIEPQKVAAEDPNPFLDYPFTDSPDLALF